jgi:type II secretory pathway pseudopilin PulG
MLPSRASTSTRGMTIAETLAAAIVLLIATVVLVPSAEHSRRLSQVGEDLSHLRTIAANTSAYAADFQDKIWQLSWRANQTYWSPGDPSAIDFTPQSTDSGAARQQMTYIIRRRGNRTATEVPNMAATLLFPYTTYSHLALLDFMDVDAPSRVLVSSGDHRWKWANDPRGYDQGLYTPNLGIGGLNARHPYGSSWRLGTCFYDTSPVGWRVAPGSNTGTVILSPNLTTIDGKPLSGVTHPSQKVLLHDLISRHFGPRQAYHMYPEARVPTVMVDSSASIRSYAEANAGANPNQPGAAAPQLTYTPSTIEPPATGANVGPVYPGPLWTRMGLQGRDFGGPEVYPTP